MLPLLSEVPGLSLFGKIMLVANKNLLSPIHSTEFPVGFELRAAKPEMRQEVLSVA